MAEGVAYLVSQYPALSHTFIEREIAALRELGVRVESFSVRPADPAARFPPETLEERLRTQVIQDGHKATLALDALHVLLTSPGAVVAGLLAAMRSGRRSLRGKLWQVFYLVEAMRLVRLLESAGLSRLHVHHANNAADIARLAVVLGQRRRPGLTWRWTLALHGPAEFLRPEEVDLRAKLESASRIAAISTYAVGAARAIAPNVDVDRFGIVRMSAPENRYRASADLRFERSRHTITVLFVGRLVEEKAPELLVEAVRRLHADGVDVKALIAGEGPLRDALQAQIARLGLRDHIALLGPVSQADLPSLYQDADVFCLPSYAEGIPVVLMEAMLTELPVISSTVAGIPELVRPDSGVLVRPGAVAELTQAIARLAQDHERRRAMGRSGRAAVLRDFRAAPNALRLRRLILDEEQGSSIIEK